MSAALALVLALAGVPPAGSITGRITYAGEPPAPRKIDPTTDAAICSQQDLVDESLLVDAKTKGIANTVLRVAGTSGVQPQPRELDNYRCRYEPHVLVVPAGTELTIRNRDRFLHTSQARDDSGRSLFNVALPSKDQEVKKKLDRPGVFAVHCDVHDWMKAWAVVTGGELATVTKPDGSFELTGVPSGKHRILLWHEQLGERTAEVTVVPGKEAKLDLTWGPTAR